MVCYHPLHVNKHSIVFCLLLHLNCCRTSPFNCQSQRDAFLFFSFCLHLFAPWLTAGETRDLRDAGIFCSFFPSCPRRCHACVLHWHANNTQSNDLAQGLRRTPPNPTPLSICGEAASAVLSIGDPESGRLKVNGETALFVNRSKFSA